MYENQCDNSAAAKREPTPLHEIEKVDRSIEHISDLLSGLENRLSILLFPVEVAPQSGAITGGALKSVDSPQSVVTSRMRDLGAKHDNIATRISALLNRLDV